MARIKFKTKKKSQQDKRNLLHILANHDVFATNIYEAHDGFVVSVSNPDEIDKIFGPTSLQDLTVQEFQAILPPELKSKRSVLLFNCPEEITRHSKVEIKDEIQRLNPYTENMVEEVYRFPNKPIIKVTFTQTAVANKAREAGLRLFSMSIPSHSIQEEEHIPVQACMRCYTLETHYMNQCPKDKDYKICSECGAEGHKWNSCTNPNKTCINCGGQHRTLAYKCPVRKQIVNNKREEIKNKKSVTYSAAAAPITTSTQNLLTSNTNTGIDIHTTQKIITCNILAHFANIEVPGSFETKLNNLLEANNFPTVNVPYIPNSRAIFPTLNPIPNIPNTTEIPTSDTQTPTFNHEQASFTQLPSNSHHTETDREQNGDNEEDIDSQHSDTTESDVDVEETEEPEINYNQEEINTKDSPTNRIESRSTDSSTSTSPSTSPAAANTTHNSPPLPQNISPITTRKRRANKHSKRRNL